MSAWPAHLGQISFLSLPVVQVPAADVGFVGSESNYQFWSQLIDRDETDFKSHPVWKPRSSIRETEPGWHSDQLSGA